MPHLTHCFVLGFGLLVVFAPHADAQDVVVEVVDDSLGVSAPEVRFIAGRARDRLHDGAAVVSRLRLIIASAPGGPPIRSVEERFVISYDLWEERFAVTRTGSESVSISNLTAREVERWCLDQLEADLGGIGPGDRFWVRLEYEVAEPEEAADDDSLFTLGGLVDILSRRRSNAPQNGSIEAGPFRRSDFR